ncbi:ABC transporter ATP-binding protein [Castellaniella sp. GW247-6E4]|uniref:ABC transporter ATP-binding protein n=1 Tax=Castellaniella sp. GW247-6E4 TaxID=3140380 RepID=UPI0033155CF3
MMTKTLPGQPAGNGQGRIDARNLTVQYPSPHGPVKAVDSFNLMVEPGEFVCLLGPSGCGKSTILNVIAGFLRASSGSVQLDGEPIVGAGQERGVVFQRYVLFPWLNVLQNVEYGLKVRGVDKKTRQEKAREYLQLVGLAGFERKYPKQLSGGMQQRVGIARVLVNQPKVMLMDEPFGALDSQTRYMMQELTLQVSRKDGTTILFVTHDLDEALLLGDRICVITAYPGRVKEIITNPIAGPRTPDIVSRPEFVDTRRRIYEMLRDEIRLSFDQEAQKLGVQKMAG